MKKKAEETITEYPVHIETKVALLESSISNINETLNRLEKRFDKIDDQLEGIKKDMKLDFRFAITAICALAAVMAHGFHWF